MVWTACHSGMAEISSHQCVTAWTVQKYWWWLKTFTIGLFQDSKTGVNYFVTKVMSRNTFACYSYTLVGNLRIVKMLGKFSAHFKEKHFIFQFCQWLLNIELIVQKCSAMKSDAGTQCKTGDINSFPFNITKIGECDSLNAGERFLLKVSIAAMAVTLSLMSS